MGTRAEAIDECNGQHVLPRRATARKSMALQRELRRRRGMRLDLLPSLCDGPCEWHGILLPYGQVTVAQFQSAMDILGRLWPQPGGKP